MSNVVRDSLVCAAPAATQSARVKITRIVLRRMRTTFSLHSVRYRGSTAMPVISCGQAPTAIDGHGSLGRRRDCNGFYRAILRSQRESISRGTPIFALQVCRQCDAERRKAMAKVSKEPD